MNNTKIKFIERSNNEHRINNQIRVPNVTLIDSEGNNLGVLSTFDAIRRAKDEGLDLVEVANNVRPPVCKIMDYGKFRYNNNVKIKKNKSGHKHDKEVWLRPNTDKHDLDTKIKSINNFLAKGHSVNVVVKFKNAELKHPELGQGMIEKVIAGISEHGKIRDKISNQGKTISCWLEPLIHAQ